MCRVYCERPLCECSAAVRTFCEELESDGSRSFHLHQFLLDMLEDELSVADSTARPSLIQRALEACRNCVYYESIITYMNFSIRLCTH